MYQGNKTSINQHINSTVIFRAWQTTSQGRKILTLPTGYVNLDKSSTYYCLDIPLTSLSEVVHDF